MFNVGAVVLCGGRSRRMGRPKCWLPFGDETLLGRVVRLVGEVASPVVVVAAGGQDVPPLPADVRIAIDPTAEGGPLVGLAAGLAAFPDSVEFVYATATDSPLLVPAWITRLVDRIGTNDLAIPRAGGYLQPLAALYRRAPALREIDVLMRENIYKPGALAGRLATVELDASAFLDVDPALGTLRNLNTPEEYQTILREVGLGDADGRDDLLS